MYGTSFSPCAIGGSWRIPVAAPRAGIPARTVPQSTGIAAGLQEQKAGEEFLGALCNKCIYLFHSETKKNEAF